MPKCTGVEIANYMTLSYRNKCALHKKHSPVPKSETQERFYIVTHPKYWESICIKSKRHKNLPLCHHLAVTSVYIFLSPQGVVLVTIFLILSCQYGTGIYNFPLLSKSYYNIALEQWVELGLGLAVFFTCINAGVCLLLCCIGHKMSHYYRGRTRYCSGED